MGDKGFVYKLVQLKNLLSNNSRDIAISMKENSRKNHLKKETLLSAQGFTAVLSEIVNKKYIRKLHILQGKIYTRLVPLFTNNCDDICSRTKVTPPYQ